MTNYRAPGGSTQTTPGLGLEQAITDEPLPPFGPQALEYLTRVFYGKGKPLERARTSPELRAPRWLVLAPT